MFSSGLKATDKMLFDDSSVMKCSRFDLVGTAGMLKQKVLNKGGPTLDKNTILMKIVHRCPHEFKTH